MAHGPSGRRYLRNRKTLLDDCTVCWICGHEGADTADHVWPRSYGGGHELSNLRPAHGVDGCPTCGRKCNSSRGNKLAAPKIRRSRDW